jgi:RNA polymerase sigma-70 factor (ECF subfamily)
MSDDTRLSLLERIRESDDPDSWSQFYAIYDPVLRSFVRSKGIGNEADIDDIVQELLIALSRRLKKLDFDKRKGKFRTYLWQSANHAVISWYRKNAKHRQAADVAFDSRMLELEYQSQRDPDEEFVRAIRKRVMEQALLEVQHETPPQRWHCFQMHVLDRQPAAQVADNLGIKSNLVFVNASRTMKRLRDLTAQMMEDHDDH